MTPYLLSPMCRFKRFRVYRHHVHMCLYMWTCCRCTPGRFECTHGGVLNLHTGVFSVPHHARRTRHNAHTPRPQPQPQPQRHTTTATNTHTHTTTTTTTTTTTRNDSQRHTTTHNQLINNTNQPTHTTRAQQHTQQQHNNNTEKRGRETEMKRDKMRREKKEETRLRCDTHHSVSALIWRFCYEGMT